VTGPTLAQLILQVKGDRSFRELMERAAGFGADLKLSSWQQWGDPEFERKLLPDPPSIRAFAKGLGISETEVLLAAARQVGLDVGEGNSTDLVIAGAGALDPIDRNILASLAATLVAKSGSGGGS
jgi:hypothetical protein